MAYKLYQVTMVGVDRSPWELLAKSEDHAILTIRKFYPNTRTAELVATELTLTGSPITLLHKLHYGATFYTIACTASGKPAIASQKYVRGDFDPTCNEYVCYTADTGKPVHMNPYTKIIESEA